MRNAKVESRTDYSDPYPALWTPVACDDRPSWEFSLRPSASPVNNPERSAPLSTACRHLFYARLLEPKQAQVPSGHQPYVELFLLPYIVP